MTDLALVAAKGSQTCGGSPWISLLPVSPPPPTSATSFTVTGLQLIPLLTQSVKNAFGNYCPTGFDVTVSHGRMCWDYFAFNALYNEATAAVLLLNAQASTTLASKPQAKAKMKTCKKAAPKHKKHKKAA